MLKVKMENELNSGRHTNTISVVQYNKNSCIHRTLIRDYSERSISGELECLREIFDKSTFNYELKSRKIDTNLEDQKIDLKTLEKLWEMADEDHKPISH